MASNDKQLNLIVDLVNRTEKGFKQLYDNLEATEKRVEKTTRFMREIGTVGTVAFAALGYGAKKAIDEASDLEESINAVNVVFGEGADRIHAFGKNSATAVGLATSELNQMATLTGALLKSTGLSTDEVADQTLRLTERAADMASVFNTDVEDAMTAINQALRGETEGIRRYAGEVTDAELQTFALSKGIDKQVTSMSQAEKRLLRLEKIMADTEVTAGDFANTSDSLANRQRILSNQFQNMQAKLGEQLIPVIEKAFNAIAPVVTKVGEWIEKNPELTKNLALAALAITGLMAVMLPLSMILPRLILSVGYAKTAFGGLNTIMKTMGSRTVGDLVKALGMKLAGAFKILIGRTNTATASMGRFAAVSKAAGSIFRVGLLAVAVWGATKIYELAKEIGRLTALTDSWGKTAKYIFTAVKAQMYEWALGALEAISWVVNAIPGIDGAFDESIEKLKAKSDEAGEAAGQMALDIGDIGTASNEMSEDIDTDVTDVLGSLDDLTGGTEDAADAAKKHFESVVEAVTNIRDEIKETYNEIQDSTQEFNKSLSGEQQSYENDIVGIVADAHEKKKQLEKELRDARKKDDNKEEVNKLKEQIDEQEDIIESYKDLEIDLDEEVAEHRKYLRMNEIEQLEYDHKKKLDLMKKEYLQEQVNSLKKLLVLQNEHNQVLALMTAEERAKIESEIRKGQSHRERLANEKAGLTTWMSQSKAMYDQYVKDINSTLGNIKTVVTTSKTGGSISTSHRATGGSVQPGRPFMVGEKGPELFSPDTYGRIHANGSMGGGNVTIVFKDNHFTDADFMDDIERQLEARLKRNMRFSLP